MALGTLGHTELQTTSPSWSPGATGTNTLTIAATVDSLGTNRMGVVLMNWEFKPANMTSLDGVTWDGSAMTLLTSVSTTSGYSQVAYLGGIAHGASKNIVISASFSSAPVPSQTQITIVWFDMDGTITYDNETHTSGTTEDPTTFDTSISAAGIVLSGVGSNANSVGSGFLDGTQLNTYDAGGNCFSSGYSTPAGSGTITHRHDFSADGGLWTGVSVAFIEGGAPPAGGVTKPSTMTILGVT